MISPILAKLYGSILEKKISIWLERHIKRVKGHAGFRGYHSTMDLLVILRIIAEECCNNKINLLCCFIDFRKHFDNVHGTNLWNRLEEIKVPSRLIVVVLRLYENTVKFRSTEGWSEEIKRNIGVNQGCLLPPTFFGIYIDKLEDFLEAAGCVGPNIASIVVILLLYADDILFWKGIPMTIVSSLEYLRTSSLVHESL
jgi:hypothetical protein